MNFLSACSGSCVAYILSQTQVLTGLESDTGRKEKVNWCYLISTFSWFVKLSQIFNSKWCQINKIRQKDADLERVN